MSTATDTLFRVPFRVMNGNGAHPRLSEPMPLEDAQRFRDCRRMEGNEADDPVPESVESMAAPTFALPPSLVHLLDEGRQRLEGKRRRRAEEEHRQREQQQKESTGEWLVLRNTILDDLGGEIVSFASLEMPCNWQPRATCYTLVVRVPGLAPITAHYQRSCVARHDGSMLPWTRRQQFGVAKWKLVEPDAEDDTYDVAEVCVDGAPDLADALALAEQNEQEHQQLLEKAGRDNARVAAELRDARQAGQLAIAAHQEETLARPDYGPLQSVLVGLRVMCQQEAERAVERLLDQRVETV